MITENKFKEFEEYCLKVFPITLQDLANVTESISRYMLS